MDVYHPPSSFDRHHGTLTSVLHHLVFPMCSSQRGIRHLRLHTWISLGIRRNIADVRLSISPSQVLS